MNKNSRRTDCQSVDGFVNEPTGVEACFIVSIWLIQRSTPVVSINPLLKFITRAATIEDHHLLWFQMDQGEAAKKQLDQRLKEVRGDTKRKLAFLIPTDGEYDLEESLGKDFATAFNIVPCFLDTLDRTPETGDYLSVMRENIELLKAAIREDIDEQTP